MKKTRRMSRASQIAFANAWLEAQGIEKQTIDTESLIDSSVSYEENIKNLKKILALGGRSKKMATRTMSAAECDVHIGNFGAGFNGIEAKRACECGDPDACDHVAKKPKPKPKPKPKKKSTSTTRKKHTAQATMRGKKKPQKKPKKAKACKAVRVKGYTRKCPGRRR